MSKDVIPSNYFCNACEIYMVTDTQNNILCPCCGKEACDIWKPTKTNSFSASTAGICPSCGGQLDLFMGSQYHCWDCGNVYDPSQVSMGAGITQLLTDDEVDDILENNKLSSIEKEPKLKCPECDGIFIREGIKLFTSIEEHKCGDCGHEWI